MIRLEEYIKKRKSDDRLDEFDLSKKTENMQYCVNYVFEYFNNYLDIDNFHQELVEQDLKINRYKNEIRDYNLEVQDWLFRFYNKYQSRVHRPVEKLLKSVDIYLLINEDAYFRKLSYDVYAKLNKKYPGIGENVDLLFEIVKDFHRIQSENYDVKSNEYHFATFLGLPVNIQEYIEDVNRKYKVNLFAWAYHYADEFSSSEDKWPLTQKLRTKYENTFDYDYKAKKNLYNLDIIYPQVASLPYLKGKKKLLELLVKFVWHDMIEHFDDKFLQDFKTELENYKI